MENFFPSLLIELLTVSITFSIILMATIQKLKSFQCIKNSCHVMLLNIFLAFALGIPFCITFYSINWHQGIWVGLFSFVGASTIYETLKKQNVLSNNNLKSISRDNVIKRNK